MRPQPASTFSRTPSVRMASGSAPNLSARPRITRPLARLGEGRGAERFQAAGQRYKAVGGRQERREDVAPVGQRSQVRADVRRPYGDVAQARAALFDGAATTFDQLGVGTAQVDREHGAAGL